MRDGIVLGATVGFGFAAMESAGYAFNALFTATGLSLPNLVETELLRGILTPVGHGLWGLLILDALIGLLVLRGRWRQATTLDRRDGTAPDRPGSLAAVTPVSAEEKQQ